jgi:copper chaperone CopZ
MKTLKFITFILTVLFFNSCNFSNPKTARLPESKVKLTFKIGGMTCNECEQSIQKKVAALPGVDSIKASYIDSIAIVFADTSKAGTRIITEAIESRGYKVNNVKIE